jgi:coenzyme F420-0:L-glutamate ligase/coenzyme F420-1:gamma-L-glutamate ligase
LRLSSSLTITPLDGIPTVTEGADLAAFILDAASTTDIALRDGDVLVIAQKIVSKAEGRRVLLRDVTPTAQAVDLAGKARKDPRVVELILRESKSIIRCVPNVIVVEHRLGLVMANAGIDASNVESEGGEEAVLLLPEDPDRSAALLRDAIRIRTTVDVGVVVNDSFGRAWRLGTVGTAIGAAGVPTLADLRGEPDRNGRRLQSTELAVADEVAAAGSLMMGQAAEGRPVVHVRGLPYALRDGRAADLIRPKHMDLFR